MIELIRKNGTKIYFYISLMLNIIMAFVIYGRGYEYIYIAPIPLILLLSLIPFLFLLGLVFLWFYWGDIYAGMGAVINIVNTPMAIIYLIIFGAFLSGGRISGMPW